MRWTRVLFVALLLLFLIDWSRPPSGTMPANMVEWLRPSEFLESPVLFAAGDAVGSVTQGAIGNGWFLSAVAILSSQPALLKQLFVPTGQEAQVWLPVPLVYFAAPHNDPRL